MWSVQQSTISITVSPKTDATLTSQRPRRKTNFTVTARTSGSRVSTTQRLCANKTY